MPLCVVCDSQRCCPRLWNLLSAIGVATVFGFGCWQVVQGQLQIGGFIWYIAVASLMFKPIKTIGLFNNVLQQSLASAKRIFYVLDFEREAYKREKQLKLPSVRGEVEFREVSFGYEHTNRSSSISAFRLNRARLLRWWVGVEAEKQRYSIYCRVFTKSILARF